MSRMIRFHQFGPAEVLQFENVEVGSPAPGEVLIAVKAIGVNWHDVLWRQDLAPRHPRLPTGLGSEVAGEVLAVGEGVERFKVGDAVASFPAHDLNDYPAYGERVLMPQTSLVIYPDVLTPEQACVHYTPLLIAYFGLRDLAQLQAGQQVLMTDASHCTGPSAVQLASALGARVIATTDTSEDRDFLLELGASAVIATEEEDLVGRVQKLTEGRGVEVILDACGGSQMALLGDVMAPCGKLVLYGLNGGNETAFPACAAFEKNIKFFLHCLGDFTGLPELGIPQKAEAVERALTHINQLTADRLLQPAIARVYGFDEVVEAHRYLESGAARGRVALRVD
ncbi:alcohol dehydrogenase [Stutzerimonas nosocomialis]|uniref:Alcohol dehydrogenase n=1 Tax=Stutzerimonas nosocomialis TaxID=1056496 RepID=A0A5R9QC76_9GAMM|nr:zinc-dependent alcohol dehydrogenase family protein [Stutzerimonas nosocomialis]TLX56065.1 alcohol dehydrogenase [Stutzerimonas nosocomialis]TLX57620.1 alcohol dehydrogenase [Stutzerimonas nosocomialis]TLX62739.1 alcohol dehydrogenase [Stutzerimonas nosocomialis]